MKLAICTKFQVNRMNCVASRRGGGGGVRTRLPLRPSRFWALISKFGFWILFSVFLFCHRHFHFLFFIRTMPSSLLGQTDSKININFIYFSFDYWQHSFGLFLIFLLMWVSVAFILLFFNGYTGSESSQLHSFHLPSVSGLESNFFALK